MTEKKRENNLRRRFSLEEDEEVLPQPVIASTDQNINEVSRFRGDEVLDQKPVTSKPQKPVEVVDQRGKELLPHLDEGDLDRYSAYFFRSQLQKLDRIASSYYQINGVKITPSDILRQLVDQVDEAKFLEEVILPARKVARWKR